jgi:hypothetical protein
MNELTLLPFQELPYKGLVSCFWNYHHNPASNRGRLLVMPAGCGKTFVFSKALAEAFKQGYIPPIKDVAPCSILVITVAKAITQTQRVLLKAGVTHALVTSHASMSKTFGDGMIKWVGRFRGNEMVESPVWDKDASPSIIILDESQYVKNQNTLIAEIIEAAVKQGILVITVSATPFTRPSETTITNLSLKLIATREHNQSFMSQFYVGGASYEEYSPGTMKNYNAYLVARELKLEAHDIKFPHRVFNKCVLIDFESEAHRRMYDEAYKEYLRKLAEAGREGPSGIAKIWVAMLKYRQTAEVIRSGQLAKVGKTLLDSTGKQIIIASNFRDSLDLVKTILIDKYHIKEKEISIIIGGRNCQGDIDRFQYGKSNFCLLTLKSGGAGLSLHHEHKVARPRYGIIPPTWSAIELVQLLGRAHRINSLSTTYQDVVWFRDTIEEDVAAKVQIKMGSLKEVVSRRETWVDLFSAKSKEEMKEIEDSLNKDILQDMGDGDEEAGNIFLNSLPVEAMEEAGV